MDANSGFVLTVIVQQQGAAMFTMSNLAGTWPSCATQVRVTISTATPAGQALYAMVLSAVKTHTPLTVHGKGNCDVCGDSEAVEFLNASS